MIKLQKSTFFNEKETKERLCEFITQSHILSMGEECRKFEEAFASKQGCNHAVFVNSGSSANLILIQSFLNSGRLKKGDIVGVSALTWATNIMPLIQLGLQPFLVDCEVDSLNVSEDRPRIGGQCENEIVLASDIGEAKRSGSHPHLVGANGAERDQEAASHMDCRADFASAPDGCTTSETSHFGSAHVPLSPVSEAAAVRSRSIGAPLGRRNFLGLEGGG